jgi:hypothetical protein
MSGSLGHSNGSAVTVNTPALKGLAICRRIVDRYVAASGSSRNRQRIYLFLHDPGMRMMCKRCCESS